MKRTTITLACTVLAVASLGIARYHVSGPNQKDPPTPIQVGVMSEKQREHGKLYTQYTGRKLDAIPQREFKSGVEPGVYIEPPTPVINPDMPPLLFEDFLRHLRCDVDAVFSVTIKDKAAQLTENKEFIFTDYTAIVEELYKNNDTAPIGSGGLITVTRPGGRVEIDGKVVSALDSSFKHLKVGQRYLLFLKFLPQTSSFQCVRLGCFLINANELIPMTEESLPGGVGDTREFNLSVRTALSAACK